MIVPLSELHPGQSVQVIELKSKDPARLDRLGAFGLVPGSLVRLEQAQPAFILQIGETEISVDKAVASEIMVQVESSSLSAPTIPSMARI